MKCFINDALNTFFYLRLYSIGQNSTYHSLCYTSRGALAGTRNSSMGPPSRIDPTTDRTMSEYCYHGNTSRSVSKDGIFFYFMMSSTHFIYIYMASEIWLRTIEIMKGETCCHYMSYSFRLAAGESSSLRQDSSYHSLLYQLSNTKCESCYCHML